MCNFAVYRDITKIYFIFGISMVDLVGFHVDIVKKLMKFPTLTPPSGQTTSRDKTKLPVFMCLSDLYTHTKFHCNRLVGPRSYKRSKLP